MSDLISIEIQEEIIVRLPLKPLIQFRSVSKAWKSLIDSTAFITRHISLRHTLPQRLVVLYRDPRHNYVTFDLHDQTFPQNRSVLTIPLSLERLKSPKIVGSSQGLLCLSGFYDQDTHYYNSYHPNISFVNRQFVIWNPSIRKAVIVPNLSFSPCNAKNVIGFGVSPVTGDPTIVEISRKYRRNLLVKVFKLSTGAWTNPSNYLPTQVHNVKWSQVVLDKFSYWFAYDRICKTGPNGNLILSFDMTNDKFGVVDLPEHLAIKAEEHFEISKLRESLVVLEYGMINNICDVWVMESTGAKKSFKKLFTAKVPDAEIKILGFNKSDYPIMEMRYKGEDPEEAALAVYDPCSKHITALGINGEEHFFYVYTYMETLLLLDEPEL